MTIKPKSKPLVCSICGGPIDVHPGSNWTRGHNAQPINDGRCCTECNSDMVIPARIAILQRARREGKL
jgi:hypothetical protein